MKIKIMHKVKPLELVSISIRKGAKTINFIKEKSEVEFDYFLNMDFDDISISNMKYNEKEGCYTNINIENQEKESNCRLPIKSDCEHRILAQGKFCTVNKTDCHYFKKHRK